MGYVVVTSDACWKPPQHRYHCQWVSIRNHQSSSVRPSYVSRTRYVPLSQHSPHPHSLQDHDALESLDVLNRMPTVTKVVYATIGSVPIHRVSLGSRLWGALGLQIVRLLWSDSLDC
jgi:hypothetical protein